MRKVFKIVLGVSLGLLIIASVVLGLVFSGTCLGSNCVKVHMDIDQLSGHSISPNANFRLLNDHSKSFGSSTAFNYAVIDSMKLGIISVEAENAQGSFTTMKRFSSAAELEIGNVDVIPISIDSSMPAGNYTHIKARFSNQWSLKAYCKTATKLVYTTNKAVKAIDLNGLGDTLPSDYAEFTYNFGYVTTSASVNDPDGSFQESTVSDFVVTAGAQLKLLVDNSYLVTCYDGSASADASANLGQFPGALDPFTWHPNSDLQSSDYFPGNAPNFGMSYIPLFSWVGAAGEAAPIGETYICSQDEARVTGDNIDFYGLPIATIAYKSNGDVLMMRSRNGDDGGNVYQNFHDYTLAEEVGGFAAFTASNGAHIQENGEGRFIADRLFVIPRTNDTSTAVKSTMKDGPECGTNQNDPDYGRRDRDCLGEERDFFWRQIDRV